MNLDLAKRVIHDVLEIDNSVHDRLDSPFIPLIPLEKKASSIFDSTGFTSWMILQIIVASYYEGELLLHDGHTVPMEEETKLNIKKFFIFMDKLNEI